MTTPQSTPPPSAADPATDTAARAAEAFRRASNAYQEGKLAEAEALCEETLRLEPRHFDAVHLLGIANLLCGRAARAAELLGHALALEPGSVAAHGNHGNACYQLGRYEDAITSYESAIALCPQLPEAYNNRGNALRALRRYPAAVASYDAAIALRPDYPDAHGNRGLTLYDQGAYEDAIESYERALSLRPDHAPILHNRGNALRELKRYEEAVASYDQSLSLAPHADAYNDRGIALAALSRCEEALASYDEAVVLDPESPEGHANRGNVLRELGQYEAAAASFDRAWTLEPGMRFLAGARLYAKLHIAAWGELEAARTELAAGIHRGEAVANPLCLVTLSDSMALQRRAAEIWVRQTCPPSTALPVIGRYERRERVRIGYFSADFRDHPVAMLSAPVFEAHDRSRFELLAFSYGPDTRDGMRTRLEGAFDRFIDVRSLDDRALARLARSLGLDLAVDLGGFTAGSRPGIFALRVAPIQVSYLGYPGTLAAPYIDYLIGDSVVIPASARAGYAEKVVRLPHCYLAPGGRPPMVECRQTRAECGLPEEGFVYCAFVGHTRILPPLFESWMRLLQAVDGSVLWLRMGNDAAVRNLRAEAARHGIAPERLVFAPYLPKAADHLARHRLADLFLDTLPYNAHTTAADALWAGLPVLSRAGEAFAARVGASLLQAIGLPELVTTTSERYEALALELARSPERLAALRQRLIAQRATTPLFDAARFTRHLESAYLMMYERLQRDLTPEHIDVAGG